MSDPAALKSRFLNRRVLSRIAFFAAIYGWIAYALFGGAFRGSAGGVPKYLQKQAPPADSPAALPASSLVQAPGPTPGHTGTLRMAGAVAAPAGSTALSWRTLGGFEYSKGMALPDAVRALQGKTVSITGFMLILDRESRIVDFVLVEALWSCCFGTPPDVNQVIMVDASGLGGVEFTNEPVQVTGTLDVGERLDGDGMIVSVYRLRAKEVRRVR